MYKIHYFQNGILAFIKSYASRAARNDAIRTWLAVGNGNSVSA